MATISDERTAEVCQNEAEPDHCNYYVTRKRRFCKMTVRRGEMFCGEHRNLDVENGDCDLIRVPCPLDNKHSCYARLLKKHLKKCNAGKQETHDYVIKDVNRGHSSSESVPKVTLSLVESDVIICLLNRIKLLDVPDVILQEFSHPVLADELNNNEYGVSTRKHLLQNSSLLGHLVKIDVMKPDTCFIEFGAGRGQLSYWIGEAMSQKGSPCLLVPIDRANNRHKFDSRHRTEDLVKIHRLRVDIGDLCLGQVTPVKESASVVAVCKHLCGDATDLALQCLATSNLTNITAIIMAPCCHHRLEWHNYVGKEFFQTLKFTQQEFQLMASLASWATCGQSNFSRDVPPKPMESEIAGLSPEEHETIGRKCKILLDYGRLLFLGSIGFKCKMVYYTDKCVSPENICLIGFGKYTPDRLNVGIMN